MTQNRVDLLRLQMRIEGEENLREAARLIDDIREEMVDLGRVEQQQIRIAEAHEQAIAGQNNAMRQQAQAAGASRSTAGSNRIGAVDRIGSFGSQILSGLGQGELANAAGVVGDLAGGIEGLGAVAVPAAIAVAAVAAAGALYVASTEKQSAAISKLASSQEAYYRVLRDGTTENARQELQNAQQRLAELTTMKQELTAAQDAQFAESQQLILGDLGARIRTAATTILDGNEEAVATRLADLNAELIQQEALVERFTGALSAGAFATNDAEEAERRLTEARLAAADAAIQQQIERDGLLRNGTSDSVRERIQALADEQNAINSVSERLFSLAQTSNEASDQLATYAERQLEIANEISYLNNVALPYVESLERERAAKEALSDQTDAYLKALEQEGATRDAIRKAQDGAIEDAQKAAADAAKAASEAETRRAEIIADANERLADIESRGAKEREKIIRDYARTQKQAIGERDALAAKQAQDAAAERIKDQADSEQDAIVQQQKALDKQLRQVDDALRRQTATIEDNYRRQQQITAAAIARLQVDLTNHEYTKNAIAMSGANSQRIIHGDMWNSIYTTATNYAQAIVNSINFILGGAGGGGAGGGIGGGAGGAQPIAFGAAVNQAVDYRLNTYFQRAGLTER